MIRVPLENTFLFRQENGRVGFIHIEIKIRIAYTSNADRGRRVRPESPGNVILYIYTRYYTIQGVLEMSGTISTQILNDRGGTTKIL